MRTLWIVAFFIVGMVAAFYAGNSLVGSRLQSAQNSTAQDIIEAARAEVKEPVLPPRPAGETRTTLKEVRTRVQVPHVVSELKDLPFGIKMDVPRVVLKEEESVSQVPITEFVNANPEEIRKWEDQVKKLRGDYEVALQKKIREISDEKSKTQSEELRVMLSGWTKDVIVPLLTAVAALLAAIAGLRRQQGAKQ